MNFPLQSLAFIGKAHEDDPSSTDSSVSAKPSSFGWQPPPVSYLFAPPSDHPKPMMVVQPPSRAETRLLRKDVPTDSPGFVAVYVKIDPANPDQFQVPRQTLTYQNKSIVWGPSTLPSHLLPACHIPKRRVTSLSVHPEPSSSKAKEMNRNKNATETAVTTSIDGEPARDKHVFNKNPNIRGNPDSLAQIINVSNTVYPLHRSADEFMLRPATSTMLRVLDPSFDHLSHSVDGTQRIAPSQPQQSQQQQPPPIKPLTAFNYFYRDERNNIVSGGDTTKFPSPVSDFSESKLRQLLHERWHWDPFKKRRRHRKSHGMIHF